VGLVDIDSCSLPVKEFNELICHGFSRDAASNLAFLASIYYSSFNRNFQASQEVLVQV
jgi:hypothetical protein